MSDGIKHYVGDPCRGWHRGEGFPPGKVEHGQGDPPKPLCCHGHLGTKGGPPVKWQPRAVKAGRSRTQRGGLMTDFKTELTELINRHSRENDSNTPDWILAQYVLGCVFAFNQAVQQRETWYGRDARPSEPIEATKSE